MITTAGEAWRRGGRVAGAALGALVVGLAGLVLVGPFGAGGDDGGGLGAPLPAPPKSALNIPRPLALAAADRRATRWAPVRIPVVARRAPSLRAAGVTMLATKTPEGTANLVVVLPGALRRGGRLWVRARVPARAQEPMTGWVPRRSLGGYRVVKTRLVVDLRGRTATLMRAGRVVLRAPVGVGLPASPTPRGEFYVRDRLERYASPVYGPLAFGTSARSNLSEWPAGGFVGIHGTDQPQLVPGSVSRGCIRMRNADIERLGRLMPVGTPLRIR